MMKNIRFYVLMAILGVAIGIVGSLQGCDEHPSSDKVQQQQQEKMLAEGTAETGMPNIVNFRERKLLKEILELRDQTGLVTYTYLYNEMNGKIGDFLCDSIGYPIPYATQYTNPQKDIYYGTSVHMALPQADPNGLFSPASAEGTWVLCKDPNGKSVKPIYSEPRVISSPFKLK